MFKKKWNYPITKNIKMLDPSPQLNGFFHNLRYTIILWRRQVIPFHDTLYRVPEIKLRISSWQRLFSRRLVVMLITYYNILLVMYKLWNLYFWLFFNFLVSSLHFWEKLPHYHINICPFMFSLFNINIEKLKKTKF